MGKMEKDDEKNNDDFPFLHWIETTSMRTGPNTVFYSYELHEAQIDCMMLTNAKVIKDFGPYRKFDTLDCIVINFVSGEITESDNEGTELKKFKIKMIAVEDDEVEEDGV